MVEVFGWREDICRVLQIQAFTHPSSFLVGLPVDWLLWKNWPSVYNMHCFASRTPFSAAKAIHNFCFSLGSDCSSRCMDSCLMTAVCILMQLYWDPPCQAWAWSHIGTHFHNYMWKWNETHLGCPKTKNCQYIVGVFVKISNSFHLCFRIRRVKLWRMPSDITYAKFHIFFCRTV